MNFFKRILYAAFFAKYDAAQFSTSRSWRSAPLQDARLDLTKSSREILQAKSRDYERNSELYAKIADVWEQYCVGTGIQFASASSDSRWNAAADAVYNAWISRADLQSRFGFDNLQGIIARCLFVDGECFVLLTREGAYPRIQLIEAHRCKTPDSMQSEEGMSINDGVKIDSNGRPIGYYFQNGKEFKLIDASSVVHIFEPSRPGQYRGIPYATAALNTLHDLMDLRLLEMKASKDAAELSTVIYSQNGELPAGLASMASKFGTSQGVSNATTVTDTKINYYQQATGGRTLVAQTGDKIEQHVSERPGVNTREYWRLLQSDVAAASGVPLFLLYPESLQGTVARASLDAASAFFRCKTAVLATYFKRIRNYAIQVHAAFDRSIAAMPDDWEKVSSGTVRAPNVDIGRNSQAMLAELSAGTRTFTSVAAELGLDGKQLLKEKADEAEYIRKLAQDRGIDPSEISNLTVDKPERFNTEQQAATIQEGDPI